MKKIKYFREKIIISVLIFIILTGVRKYVSSYYNEDKGYEWSSLARTANNLPVMFAKCSLHHTGYYENDCEKNTMLYGDDSHSAISCGITGTDVRNELYPDSLRILYYSFSENKFYGGNFKLDYDKIQAIAEKMRKGVQIERKGSESIIFETKVYPMGKVIVSMESYLETSVEKEIIGRFQAKQENHDWSVFEDHNSNNSNSRSVSKSISVDIQRELLLSEYNWQVDIILPKKCRIKSLDVNVYGNKNLKMDTIKNAKVPTYNNFVYLPQNLYLSWKRKDTIEFSTGFDFDEQEIIKAFKTVDLNGKNLPITMQLIVKDDTTALRAVLQGNGKSIELKNIHPREIRKDKIYFKN